MSNTSIVTDEQIRDFLKYLIDIVPTLYVDDKGYPHKKDNGDDIYVSASGHSKLMKPIILYGSPEITSECAVLNPFVESLSQSAESDWFHTVITVAAANYVRWIQKSLLMHALASKDKKKKEDMDLELAAILSPYVDKVDELMMKEFAQITSKMSDYFHIFYLNKKRECRISCGLLDNPDFKVAHKKVRAKTWETLSTMMRHMFDTKDFSEFTVISKMQGCPQFDATLRVLLKVYSMLNRFFKYFPEEIKEDLLYSEIDVDYLSRCIDQLDLFRAKAKYMVPTSQPVGTKVTAGPNPLSGISPNIGLPGMKLNGTSNGPVFGLPGQTNNFMGNANNFGNTPFSLGGNAFGSNLNFNNFSFGPGNTVPTNNPFAQQNQQTTETVTTDRPFGKL